MHKAIYAALAAGLSKLIKNGLAFTVMTLVIVGETWTILYLVDEQDIERHKWEQKLIDIENRNAKVVNDLRCDVEDCKNNNRLLQIQVAELKAASR